MTLDPFQGHFKQGEIYLFVVTSSTQ